MNETDSEIVTQMTEKFEKATSKKY